MKAGDYVSKEDLDYIFKAAAKSFSDKNQKAIKDLKITLLGHELKYVSKFSFEGMRVKLEFWWGGEGDKEGSFSVDVPCNWVTLDFKK